MKEYLDRAQVTAHAAAVVEAYEKYVNPSRARLARLMGTDDIEWEAEGAVVRTARGREFIDCLGGFGTFNVGHRHPKVLEAVTKALARIPISTRVLLAAPLAQLAEVLAAITPGELQYTFPVHSGAAAVEGALKLARAATGRKKIVSTQGGFHGKTYGALSATGKRSYREPFEPLVPRFEHVPYGDEAAARAAIDEETAAFIVEPVQGEAGIIVPPDGYLRAVRQRCDEVGALLVVDEVQTGFGRTGYMFGCEHDAVAPDIMTLAKALGGGIFPLGAFVGTERAWRPLIEEPYLHTTTVESLISFEAALATIRVLQEEQLVERSAREGAYFLAELRGLAREFPDVVHEVRGRGLMIGITFARDGQAGFVMAELLAKGVLTAFTLNNPLVMRLEPPLVITRRQIDTVLERMREALVAARQVLG